MAAPAQPAAGPGAGLVVRDVAEGGFTALKVRVGRDDPADDLAAVRRVREAAGDGVTLVADYNQGLTLGEALQVSGHLLRVTPTRQWLEWQDWAHPVLAHPFEVRSGELHLPDVPGNGLAWDEDAVAHCQA